MSFIFLPPAEKRAALTPWMSFRNQDVHFVPYIYSDVFIYLFVCTYVVWIVIPCGCRAKPAPDDEPKSCLKTNIFCTYWFIINFYGTSRLPYKFWMFHCSKLSYCTYNYCISKRNSENTRIQLLGKYFANLFLKVGANASKCLWNCQRKYYINTAAVNLK